MNENISIEAIDKSNLTEQTKFRLSEIIGIENYLYPEINQRKSYSKKLSKYVTTFDYIDKILIILSIIGVPARIARASFTLIFSITTGIIKKLLSTIKIKKKKHDKILMLAKSKLNSIETLISQALDDMEISHEEFIIILKVKAKYERMKYIESENKITKLNSIYKFKNLIRKN